jgi:hypothetical protein
LGLRAAARQGEAKGVVELDRGGVEVGVQRRTGAYRQKENGGEVAPVEVRPRGMVRELQWSKGKLPKVLWWCGEGWSGLPMVDRRAPELEEMAVVVLGVPGNPRAETGMEWEEREVVLLLNQKR